MADQATGFFSPWLRRRRVKAAGRYLAGRVFDFGCGTGELAAICAPKDYVGYDIDAGSIALARQLYPQHRFEMTIPADERFDTIALLAVIEHVSEPAMLLTELKRMLSPEGRIIITTPHPSGRVLYALGARAGLFSAKANEEHEYYFGPDAMQMNVSAAGMVIDVRKRFLGGFNQLFIAHAAGIK